MDKNNLVAIEKAVADILAEEEAARDDDYILYLCFLKMHGVDVEMTLDTYLHLAKKFPSFDSVSRCRRKVQKNNPALRGERYFIRHRARYDYKTFVKQKEDLSETDIVPET